VSVAVRPDAEVSIRDGSRVWLRSIHRTDADRLARFHHSLSPETTRRRFFTFHPELSPDELARFTHVDHHDREAVVAVVGDDIVGVARYDRRPGTDEAEVAFVVTDAWQGRGLGSALFAELAARARASGITRLLADTFADNRRMLLVFLHSGLPTGLHYEDGFVNVAMALGPTTMDG
jgi:GNAT superfamily N-acetyltransferase